MGLAVQLLPRRAPLRPRRPAGGIDMDPSHSRHVDHQPALRDCATRDVVPAAADGDLEAARAGEPDRVGDVHRATAARDERGPAVDQAVVDSACLLVAVVARLQDGAGKGRGERVE